MRRLALTFALLLGATPLASAGPSPTPGSKDDAKFLMQSGVKLLEAKDYVGALAAFRQAYAAFPSAKILLNIGTTEKLLDRKPDAANAYQRYLDAPDADPARRAEVADALVELDKSLGKLAVDVTPADAQLQVGDEWLRASSVRLVRVAPGTFELHARRDGYKAATRAGSVGAGEQLAVVLQLEPDPGAATTTTTTSTTGGKTPIAWHDVVQSGLAPQPRARFGGFAMAHVSVIPRFGSAWLVGATADATQQLSIDIAVILGPGLVSSQGSYPAPPPSYGAYVGASFAFATGEWRPRVGAGMPMFFESSGARFVVRGALGLEYVVNRHISAVLEVGVEDNLNHEMDIKTVAIVPALAAVGRL